MTTAEGVRELVGDTQRERARERERDRGMERVIDKGRARWSEKEATAQRVTLKRDTRGFERRRKKDNGREGS